MTKHTYKKWTQADDAELVLMREARVPVKEIAKTLKRTPSAVANRVIVLGIPTSRTETKLKPEWWKAMMWWRK